jgi:hypothetical protein
MPVAAGLPGWHGAPGHGGSANRHTDVRGSKPQVGCSQEGAPDQGQPGIGKAANGLRTDASSWAIRSTSGPPRSGARTATEMVSCGVQAEVDRSKMRDTGHG